MYPTIIQTSARGGRRRFVPLAFACGALLAACGGAEGDDTAHRAGTSAASASDAASTTPAAAGGICDGVPSFEVISAALGEPVDHSTELERGAGWDLCEVAGGDVAHVQFARVTPAQLDESLRVARELGAVVNELEVAGLPAVSISGAVSVVIGDSEYSVQAIASDTLGVADSPLATDRSAALLAAWLDGQGLA